MKKFVNISGKKFAKVVLPLVVVAVFVSIANALVLKSLIAENMLSAATSGAQKVENEIRTVLLPEISNLNLISNMASVEQSPEVLGRILELSASQNEAILAYYYSSIESVSRGGYLVMSDNWSAPPSFDQTTRPWYTGALALKGGLYGSDIYVNARSGTKCVSFSKAVYNKDGKAVGVVGFDLDLEKLTKSIGNIQISKTSRMALVNEQGVYITNAGDPKKIMDVNVFDEIEIKIKDRNVNKFLAGNPVRVVTTSSMYYAAGVLTGSPWYVVILGKRADFEGKTTAAGIIIILITVVLIFTCAVLSVRDAAKTAEKEQELGNKLFGETQNLVVAAKETAATSQDQNAAVKEIVATMEDTNNLSENIAAKIQDVTSVAQKTSSDVSDGATALQVNVNKLHEISVANKETIDGIKDLSKEIDNIWDIVTLITSVADQAKIIAFNAELEAASAGEAGKNFHIVASEIRRLADGIIDSTKEIKDRISGIQHSSDSLILASESGTIKVEEGVESAKELEHRFNSIRSAAEITAKSAEEITTIIQQQTSASGQILITLKQISAGVENFSAATENVSSAAEKLKEIANLLNEATDQDGANE